MLRARVLDLGGSDLRATFNARIVAELADDLPIGRIAEQRTLATLRQTDGRVFQFEAQHRATRTGFDAVAHDQSLEDRAVVGFAFVTQFDLQLLAGLEPGSVTEWEFLL